jgi:16S rRNA (cytosine1402-N4)-methyltransferase
MHISEDKQTGAICHQPVLIKEVLSALLLSSPRHGNENVREIYLDCTVGLGGHTEAILNATPSHARVIAIDQDSDALLLTEKRLAPYKDRVTFCHGSFRDILEITKKIEVTEVSGILFDLGVSSMQLESAERGFSFQISGPLDMRMDRRLSATAASLVNTLREKELADLIYRYGEERGSRKIASLIVRYREKEGKITRTEELSDLVCRAVRAKSKWTRTHPATKTFQALRIAVNDEMGVLEAGLADATSLLAVGGRLVVISFHSLEDRSVKNYLKSCASPVDREPLQPVATQPLRGAQPLAARRFVNLYKKPIVPTEEEVSRNPRARSAKLRALERVA